jgi:hypothetical protein
VKKIKAAVPAVEAAAAMSVQRGPSSSSSSTRKVMAPSADASAAFAFSSESESESKVAPHGGEGSISAGSSIESLEASTSPITQAGGFSDFLSGLKAEPQMAAVTAPPAGLSAASHAGDVLSSAPGAAIFANDSGNDGEDDEDDDSQDDDSAEEDAEPDAAGELLESLMDEFKSRNGRDPTDAEVQEWMGTIKDAMANPEFMEDVVNNAEAGRQGEEGGAKVEALD